MKESRKRYCLRGGLVGSTKEASAMSTYESYRRRDRDAKRLSAPLEVEKRIQHECPSAAGAPLWPHSCEIRCRTRTPPSPEPSNADATAQEHHHLGVRSKSRSIRRSAKGTPGFSGPLQTAAGGAVAVSASLAPDRPRPRERLSPALILRGQASPGHVVHSAHDAVPAARQRCAGPNRPLHLRTTPCRRLGLRSKRLVWRPPMIPF